MSTGAYASVTHNTFLSPPQEITDINQKKLHLSNSYQLHKGWNLLQTPKDGIDVVLSFKEKNFIEAVFSYDHPNSRWACYTPSKIVTCKDDFLHLRYIEPHVSLYIKASKTQNIEVTNTEVSEECSKKIQDDNFSTLKNSALDVEKSSDKEQSISVFSMYKSHYRKGIYNDSRILLIYPKKKSASKDTRVYGTANPRMQIEYSKSYENEKFYVYDYFQKKCFMGIFPSKKIPPFPVLKELK